VAGGGEANPRARRWRLKGGRLFLVALREGKEKAHMGHLLSCYPADAETIMKIPLNAELVDDFVA
jgi:hypothetical protein